MRCARSRQGGFTLIEVMVTLAIMAMVFAMIGTILVGVLDSHARVERLVLPNKVGPSVLALMARDLQGLHAYDLELSFVGVDGGGADRSTDSFHFVTTTASRPDEDGRRALLTEVGYVLQERADKQGFYTLFRREQAGVDELPLNGGEYTPIYSNVVSLDVQYLSRDEEPTWLEAWEASPEPPAALWIHLVVAPQYEAGSGQAGDELPAPKTYTAVVEIPIDVATPVEETPEAGEPPPEGGDGGGSAPPPGGDGGGGAPPPPGGG